MAAPPPYPLVNRDQEQLGYLVIGHYIYAAIQAIASVIGFIFIGVGSLMATKPELFDSSDQPPPFVGAIVAGFGGFLTLLILVWAFTSFLAGRFIARRKHHLYCMIIAAINCLSMPLGTIIGIFTFVVLNRPTVKAQFR